MSSSIVVRKISRSRNRLMKGRKKIVRSNDKDKGLKLSYIPMRPHFEEKDLAGCITREKWSRGPQYMINSAYLLQMLHNLGKFDQNEVHTTISGAPHVRNPWIRRATRRTQIVDGNTHSHVKKTTNTKG